MSAYSGEWRVISDQPVPSELLAQARNLVGSMQDSGTPQRMWNNADGSTVHVLMVNGIPKVTIAQTAVKTPDAGLFSDLWAPRGFVVYPAFLAAKFGYGLPVIRDNGYGPYSHVNLAPGLTLSRWTAGGPCGEVLLSKDKDAGYPADARAIPVPLLYHPTFGPTFHWGGDGYYDQRAAKGAWRAYRMELAAPVDNYPDEDAAGCLSLFEGLNSYRVSNSKAALSLQPRGYYRPAKVMASIMLANGNLGAASSSYPATYQSEDDRTTKDGFSADVVGVTLDAFNRGDHLTSYELRHTGGVADALAAWKADSTANGRLLKDVGPAAFADVGSRGGFICVDVLERHRWIQAGNMNWQSSDESLPPISWHGFASLDLAWETYPATYDPANYTTAPLIPIRGFTDAQGDCWMRYPRSTSPKSADMEPAMGRHIYCRGRAIALAPRGGLVWAASVVAGGKTDRLIALVHHPDEQPADYTHEGFTRYLRVWWCDVPRRGSLRLDPSTTICGIDVADAYAWKGGQQIDLGTMPAPTVGWAASTGINSLKYSSQWRFAPDGKHAICLRDYGTFGDYGQIGADHQLSVASTNPRAVELSFDVQPASTTATTIFHEYAGGQAVADRELSGSTPPDTSDVFSWQLFEMGAVPIAVDYDKFTGKITYAFRAVVAPHQASNYVDPTDPSNPGGFIRPATYSYLGIGGAEAQYATDLMYRVLQGADFQTSHTDASSWYAVVLDVRTASFAAQLTHPRFSIDPAAPFYINQITRPCPTFTADLVNGVRLFHLGARVREDWYPCPDGALYSLADRCFSSLADSNKLLVDLPLAASSYVQGYYAERSGAAVFGYQVSPMPRAVWALGAAPAGAPCGCQLTNDAITSAHLMTDAELAPRGGAAHSTVPLPTNDWLIYAKVV